MRLSRLFLALLLFTACAALPANWATAQDEKKQDDKKATKTAKGDEETDKAIADLKKALEVTQKDLVTATKMIEALKTATSGDAKKVDTLSKELDALKTSAKGALTKADLTAISAKADALAKQVDGLKAGDPKAGEKLSAIEKAAEELKKTAEKGVADAASASTAAAQRGDGAWLLTSSAFVLIMVPGLALFYGGMVRRKNVLGTMMHSMAALAVVGVYWVAVGYALAFGPSVIKMDLLGVEGAGLLGWSSDLLFLRGVEATAYMPGGSIPVYVHVMFQGMFAIITPALISGAIAERIRFWPFCIFMLLWVTFVYCPLAHMVWAFDWFDPSVVAAKRGLGAIGLFGKMGALDFAGGTVVHIAAGMAGLACCIVLGRRAGYPQQVAHPNSMVLTLLGAGLLWFGWFGFNGGSALNSTALAGSAFAATQVAAAAAGLGWMFIECLHKGKPTALGLASGIVAGLVAVTPASGFVSISGALAIGAIASVVCYLAVAMKNVLGYDDSLDAFGVHGVGGFVGAILTGVFCSALVNSAGTDGPLAYSAHRARLAELTEGKPINEAKAAADKAAKAFDEAEEKLKKATDSDKADLEKAKTEAEEQKTDKEASVAALEKEKGDLQALADKQDDKANDGKDKKTGLSQLKTQVVASVFSVVFAFVVSLALCVLTQVITLGKFKTNEKGEADGLDRTEHGEVGFDFSAATESVTVVSAEPRAATAPKGNGRYEVTLSGADSAELMKVWTELCQPTDGAADADFLAVYPHVTTVRGTTFRCRGGDPATTAKRLEKLFTRLTGKPVSAKA